MDLFTIDYSLVIKADASMLSPGLQAPVVVPDLRQCRTQRGSKEGGFFFTGTAASQVKQSEYGEKYPHICFIGRMGKKLYGPSRPPASFALRHSPVLLSWQSRSPPGGPS